MDELKPCPFCRSEVRKEKYTNLQDDEDEPIVQCSNSRCPSRKYDWYPIEDWNTRPLEDALRAQLDMAITENGILQAQLDVAMKALGNYANQNNWRPLMGQELGEHKLYIYSGCTPNVVYAGMDAANALSEIAKLGGAK